MGVGLPDKRFIHSGEPRPATGIVHLGLGAFFRAFGCVYIADAMAVAGGDWGIVGVSLRSPTTRDALRPQGWAYNALTLDAEKPSLRRIEVLNGVLVAPEDPEAVLAAMADPAVKIVSLTVTEKGYCHQPATGELDEEHPDILHDLNNRPPRSAIGFIVRALQRRRDLGVAPFTVLSCDNLPDNGKLARGVVQSFAQLIDPTLADWIAEHGRFPCTMVDRITPATTQTDIDNVTALTGQYDAAPVVHEPFKQWAIEDNFVAGARPTFAAAGAELVTDVRRHEEMKLRMLNGTHSALAYTGYLAGHCRISYVVADPIFAGYVKMLWSEIIPTVDAPRGVDLNTYADDLFNRYANPAVRHLTWQIAMDGSQKLPQRLLETLRENMQAGRPTDALLLAVAAWMRYACGVDEVGRPIDVRDPKIDTIRARIAGMQTPAEIVPALLAMRSVFAPDLALQLKEPLTLVAQKLWDAGSSATARDLLT
jgi:fructuronate reductase